MDYKIDKEELRNKILIMVAEGLTPKILTSEELNLLWERNVPNE